MAATIVVIKTHGELGYEVESDDTEFGLKSVDDHSTTPADAPITIPTEGTNYSYECWMRFKCSVAPDNECTNFKIWGSGAAVGTGLVLKVNTNAVTTYATPVNTLSNKGTRDSFANHGSGSKISVAGTLEDAGDKTDFSVFQLEVGVTAEAGDMDDQTVYYSYDET